MKGKHKQNFEKALTLEIILVYAQFYTKVQSILQVWKKHETVQRTCGMCACCVKSDVWNNTVHEHSCREYPIKNVTSR